MSLQSWWEETSRLEAASNDCHEKKKKARLFWFPGPHPGLKKKKECPDICDEHALHGPNFSQQHRPRLRQSRAKNGAQGRGK